VVDVVADIMRSGVGEGKVRSDIRTQMLANVLMGLLRMQAVYVVDAPDVEPHIDVLVNLFYHGAGQSDDRQSELTQKAVVRNEPDESWTREANHHRCASTRSSRRTSITTAISICSSPARGTSARIVLWKTLRRSLGCCADADAPFSMDRSVTVMQKLLLRLCLLLRFMGLFLSMPVAFGRFTLLPDSQ